MGKDHFLNRREFLGRSALAGAALGVNHGAVGALAKSSDENRPNIVLLYTDDQAWEDVGYMNPAVKTPNLNAMSEEGVTFSRFYAGCSSCTPSRATFMTGRTNLRTGVIGINVDSYPIRDEERTLAHLMREAGYQTAHFGKWHLGRDEEGGPVSMGYHEAWWSNNKYGDGASFHHDTETEHLDSVPLEGDCSEATVQLALDFARKSQQVGKPFFMTICYGSPHAPYDCSQGLTSLYPDSPCAEYLAEITGIDRSIGSLRDGIRDIGEEQNTIVWFAADNGGSGQGGCGGDTLCGEDSCIPASISGGKSSMREGGIRSPGVMVWPARFSAPKTIDTPCGVVDYYPTFKSLLNVSYPSDQPYPLDGENIMPILDGDVQERERPLFFWRPGKVGASNIRPGYAERALVDKRYKIVDIGDDESDEQERYKLFDLLEDPKEQDNIAADNPEIHAEMVAMVKEWEQSVYESFQGKDYNSTHIASAGSVKRIPEILVHSRGHQLVLRFDGRQEVPGEVWLLNLHGRRVLKARVHRRGNGIPEAVMNTKGLSVGTYLVSATGHKRRSVIVR